MSEVRELLKELQNGYELYKREKLTTEKQESIMICIKKLNENSKVNNVKLTILISIITVFAMGLPMSEADKEETTKMFNVILKEIEDELK